VSAFADLEQALGSPPPKGLAKLPDDVLADLAVAVRDARAEQARALVASLDAGLRLAPRPLRPVLRKVLLG
jgi:hypothetical protein